jgi:hypothetical protein
MYDLANLTVDHLELFSAQARRLTASASNMEEAAQALVDHLASEMTTNGRRVLTGVHALMTASAARLDAGRVASVAPDPLAHARFATVLASSIGGEAPPVERLAAGTVGLDSPAWRTTLAGRAIAGLGVDFNELQVARPLAHDRRLDSWRLEHLDRDDPLAQDPMVPSGTTSLVAFGWFLPTGELVVLTLCVAATVDARSAAMLATCGLTLKASLTPFCYRLLRPAT